MRKLILILSVTALAGCNKTALTEDFGSDLSDLAFTLPEGAGTLYTGYSVSFSRYGSFESDDKCSTNKSWAKDTASRTVTVTHQVKNGCDYLIVLELGQVNAAKNGLEKVFYTNRNVQPGTIVKSSQLTGGNVEVVIKVFKTEQAPADAPGELQTQKYSNLKIDVVFDNGGDTNGSGSGQGAGPGRRAPPPPGGNQPPPTQGTSLTAFEKTLQTVRLQNHERQDAGTMFDKVNGKEHFLVIFTWVDCAYCKTYRVRLEQDPEYQRIKQSGNCPVLTAVLPGRSGLDQYKPASAYYRDPQTIGRQMGINVSGFPHTALVNRKTGEKVQVAGDNPSVVNQYKQVCR